MKKLVLILLVPIMVFGAGARFLKRVYQIRFTPNAYSYKLMSKLYLSEGYMLKKIGKRLIQAEQAGVKTTAKRLITRQCKMLRIGIKKNRFTLFTKEGRNILMTGEQRYVFSSDWKLLSSYPARSAGKGAVRVEVPLLPYSLINKLGLVSTI